jgi:U4/U6.U5 tri-snRNP-associated protein 1
MNIDLSADVGTSGKTSGRMKTDKRLKKIEEERKQLTMNSGDTPTGMTDAFARRQVKTGEAHMVLSVGNKGSVQVGNAKGKGRR